MNMKITKALRSLIALVLGLAIPLQAQEYVEPEKPMKKWSQRELQSFYENQLNINLTKPTGPSDRREGIMDGNQIRTVFYNYGAIGRPNWEPSIEWPRESGHGYAYEFGPIIGAEVVDVRGDTIHVFSDALLDGGDRAPNGKVWGWQPLPQYLNTLASTPAMSNSPESWPQTQNTTNPFYNPDNTGPENMFMWPGLAGLGTKSADLEAYWVMDDRDNDEFEYYPFTDDPLRRGLGLELTCRLMQFSASLAEDIIFYIVTVKNVSDKPIDKVVVGMFGDPHIGGPGDFSDDFAGFDQTTNMVYSYDAEGSGNDYAVPWPELGWLGFKFLESPTDDAGNQLGLTSMSAPLYASYFGNPADDEVMWDNMVPGTFSNIAQNQDNVFIFGSGYFSLDPGETQQFSIAILMGQGLDDLYANGQIAQDIYDLNYKFTKAPSAPKLTVVPDDGKVTLYWDESAEDSYDDFFGAYDFEGYKVYRSTNKINWGTPITDANGTTKFYKPIAQFDRVDGYEGFFPIAEGGVNFWLGEESGLEHMFVDDNLINGVTYYYAVTAYDSGYATLGIQPAESGREEGVNMLGVMPRSRVPGYQGATAKITHDEGFSSGSISATIIDPTVIEGRDYEMYFTSLNATTRAYNLFYYDEQTNDTVMVIENSTKYAGEPHMFDGLVLNVTNEAAIAVVDTLLASPDSVTGWTAASQTTMVPRISLYPGGKRLARDLKLKFFDGIVDTSVLVGPKPVNFQVWNTTDNEKMDFIFFDTNGDGEVSRNEKIVALIYENNVPKGSWQIEFLAPATGDTILPMPDDELNIFVAKPFETIDKYSLKTDPSMVDAAKGKQDFLANVAVVPNPYVVASSFEVPPPTVFSQGRGDRRVDFIHLPQKCTIRIYTTNGELIRKLEHDSSIYGDRHSWNLLTSEGLDIAYGIYVYHIDAGEYGEKIGKLAIIK
jgi:hypothetical protein